MPLVELPDCCVNEQMWIRGREQSGGRRCWPNCLQLVVAGMPLVALLNCTRKPKSPASGKGARWHSLPPSVG